jgi:predicted NAD/FAD-binding protein
MMKKFYTCVIACLSLLVMPGTGAFAEGQRVAVVGGGVAGLTAAWLLENDYQVTLFEIQERLGGHSNTVVIDVDDYQLSIDCGAEFFNNRIFPHFLKLLKILKVPTKEFILTYTFFKTDGSNTVVLPPFRDGEIAWDSLGPSEIFQMLQFQHLINSAEELVKKKNTRISFKKFVEDVPFITSSFKNEFVYPFLAASWGVSPKDIQQFAAYDLMSWLVLNKPQDLSGSKWLEVVGGMSAYVDVLAKQLSKTDIRLGTQITSITYDGHEYTIVDAAGNFTKVDHLILTTNANEAADLLSHEPYFDAVKNLLNSVKYYKSTLALHGDLTYMPANKTNWSVANVAYDGKSAALTIHKEWKCLPSTPIFRSWITYDLHYPGEANPKFPTPTYATRDYYHPIIDLRYFEVQRAIGKIQGVDHLWLGGMHTYDIDSHESAIISAINIATVLAPNSSRLKQLTSK